MARYIDANCRLCRRERQKLFLKGTKCFTENCPVERRGFPPGQHGQSRRSKVSPYGVQLREKQKVRLMYGLPETQFRNYFAKALKQPGRSGETLVKFLERRLDTVIYRLSLAPSRKAARQLIPGAVFSRQSLFARLFTDRFRLLYAAAGFSLRPHKRDACATNPYSYRFTGWKPVLTIKGLGEGA